MSVFSSFLLRSIIGIIFYLVNDEILPITGPVILGIPFQTCHTVTQWIGLNTLTIYSLHKEKYCLIRISRQMTKVNYNFTRCHRFVQ